MSTDDVTAEIAEAVIAVLPSGCWVTQHPGWRCTDMIGAGFPNQQKWSEGMCCVPCRVRAVLESDALADLLAARDRRVRAEAVRQVADEWESNDARHPVVAKWLHDRADRIEGGA